jgi:transcriptional regulator of acetoin/glycerol metabolism
MERLVTLSDRNEIQLADLPSGLVHPTASFLDTRSNEFTLPPEGMDIDRETDNAHRNVMGQALDRAQGNKTAAAGILGLNRTTFVERMRKLGLDGGANRQPPIRQPS